MTVLGDLAQATSPGAQRSWDAVAAHLGAPPLASSSPSSTSATACRRRSSTGRNRLLPRAAPGVAPARSVRVAGTPPTVVNVPEADIVAHVVRLAAERAARWSSVGVIVADPLYAAVGAHLDGSTAAGGLTGTTLLHPAEAKGLEFDSVVVVEPAAVAGDTSRPGDKGTGLRLLYIAMTRAVQELIVVHSTPLPAVLANAA